MESQFPGMDYDFLRYMGVTPENQRRIQSHYMPYFEQCNRVVDLACGDADFVELLVERGIEVVGVDSDDNAYAATAAKGLPIIKQDVFDWLAEQPDASFDGVFSAHLIEHLPYPKVVELIEQSYRILQPGGIVVLATPNARSLFSHLEMFYTHFGHITFYHPRLVTFFLDRAGFVDGQFGENPQTASPLLYDLRLLLVAPSPSVIDRQGDPPMPDSLVDDDLTTVSHPEESAIAYQREVPLQGRTPLHHLSHWIKGLLTHWLVQPLTDSLAQGLQERLAKSEELNAQQARRLNQFQSLLQKEKETRQNQTTQLENANRELYKRIQTFGTDIQALNGPFESYTWAYKPEAIVEVAQEQL